MARAALLCLPLILAGCTVDSSDARLEEVGLRLGDLWAPTGMALDWNGRCEGACPTHVLDILPLEGTERLEVWVAWNARDGRGVTFEVQAPDGTVHRSQEGHAVSRLFLDAPQEGRHTMRVLANASFVGVYAASAWLLAPGPLTHDLLPNLVTLVPTDLGFASPSVPNIEEAPSLEGLGGCGATELVRDQARRCLRLSNGIGNAGAGDLELRLQASQAPGAVTGDSELVQLIQRSDGTVREQTAGAAQWHDEHAHVHFSGLQQFTVYPFDLATGRQGDQAVAHTKAGFCLEDRAPMPEVAGEPEPPSHSFVYCAVPNPERDMTIHMGLTRGWYDLYFHQLPQQYVEVSGLPDGAYLLESVNVGDTLAEQHLWDNAASVVFELRGNEVTLLEEHGFYRRNADESRT